MDSFVEETEGFQSSEEIPETQVCGVGGQREDSDFDDHMAQLQQERSRYRICTPTLHVNSIANESQQRIPQTLNVESERPRRVGLRSAGTWEQRSQSQNEFNMRDVETTIGGSQNIQSLPVSTVGAIRCSQKKMQ